MNRNLILVSLALSLWGFGEGLFILFQPIYLEELGASPITIGVILGAIGVTMTLTHIPAGYASDTIGRKPLLLLAWSTGVIATWIMAISASLYVFTIGSILYGFTAFVVSPLNSYLTSVRGKFSVGRVLTLTSAAYNIGAIGGPLIGGLIGQNFGLRANFFIAAIVFVISTIIIFNIQPQPTKNTGDIQNFSPKNIFSQQFIHYLILIFIVMFSLYLPQPLSQNYLISEKGLEINQIGLLISCRSMGVVILNLFIGRLPTAFGYVLAQISVALFSLFLWLGSGLPWYFMGYLLLGGYQTARSLTHAMAKPFVRRINLGLTYGTVETINSTAIILAPPLAGLIYSHNPSAVYTISFILIAFGILISLVFLKVRNLRTEYTHRQ